MKPNIGKGGRIARAVTGTLCVLAAGLLWLVSWPETMTYRVIAIVLLVLLGVFQWFEAKRGWCLARACGIKTPM